MARSEKGAVPRETQQMGRKRPEDVEGGRELANCRDFNGVCRTCAAADGPIPTFFGIRFLILAGDGTQNPGRGHHWK